MPTDSIWHEMMIERAKELAAHNPSLTAEQIALRTGLKKNAALSKLLERARKGGD